MRGVLVLVAVAACAPPAATPVRTAPSHRHTSVGDTKIAAPDALVPMPWRVGQYARYELRGPKGVVTETVRVVANDACGCWIERSLYEGDEHWSWLFCVRGSADWDIRYSVDAVILRRDREVVAVYDLRWGATNRTRFNWLLTHVDARWAGRTDAERADVATPAGQFAGAVKHSEHGVTRWSHPAVPLGGVVREVRPDHERVLVDFKIASKASAIVNVANELVLAQHGRRADRASRTLWLRFDMGVGSVGGPSDTNLTFGVGSSIGVPVSLELDAVANATVAGVVPNADDATLSEELLLAALGARWYPWGRTRRSRWGTIQPALLYTQAELGYAHLYRWRDDSQSTTVGRGVALGARLGVVTTSARDWALGLELRDHLALLNADEGLRHTFGVHVYVQLFMTR